MYNLLEGDIGATAPFVIYVFKLVPPLLQHSGKLLVPVVYVSKFSK